MDGHKKSILNLSKVNSTDHFMYLGKENLLIVVQANLHISIILEAAGAAVQISYNHHLDP